MNNRLSKGINLIFGLAIAISAILMFIWRIILQGVSMEKHYTMQSSAYMLGILGIVMLAVVTYIRMLCKRDNGLTYLIIVNFMLATWIYLRSDAVPVSHVATMVSDVVKITMLTMLVIPIVLFFDEFQRFRYHKAYVTFLILPVFDWVCCMIAYLFFHVYDNDIFLASQIITIMTLGICIYHLVIDIKKEARAVYRQVLVSLVFILAGTSLEIFYVWNRTYYWINTLFGFLTFFSILGVFQSVSVYTVRDYLQEQHKRSQDATNSLLTILRTDVERYLGEIQLDSQYVLEHCKDDEIFVRLTGLERHRWQMSVLMHNLEDCISAYIGIESFELERVEMAEVFNYIIDNANNEAERKDIELDIRVEERFPRAIWGVCHCAQRMLLNLLLYAVDTTNDGGKVVFQTGYLDMGNDMIKLITTVESSSMGMEKDELLRLQHIFRHLDEIELLELEGMDNKLQTAAVFAKVSHCTMAIESEIGKGDRIQIATACKVADAEPIGEFEDWYVIRETYYQKYRKRILQSKKEESLENKVKEKMDEMAVTAAQDAEQETVGNKKILLAGNIHVDSALKYVGDDYEQYIQIMKLFPDKKLEKQRVLQQYYENRDYENYTIQVHALKNNARMLGADKLADMAFEHEKAGTQKDEGYLTGHYEELLAEWDRVEAVFREFLTQETETPVKIDANESQEMMSEEQWQSGLHQVIDSLELFQKKEALEILEQMREFHLLSEQLMLLERTIEAVKKYDYDGAIEILRESCPE